MLAFLALWLKLAVPLGFMPAGAAGGPVFQICSASSVPFSAKGGGPEKSPSKTGTDCVFSLLHASAVSSAGVAAPGTPLGAFAVLTASSKPVAAPRHFLFAPPPPSHAPPSLVA